MGFIDRLQEALSVDKINHIFLVYAPLYNTCTCSTIQSHLQDTMYLIYIYKYIYNIYMFVCLCVCVSVCIICIYICVCVCVCVSVGLCVYAFVCVCFVCVWLLERCCDSKMYPIFDVNPFTVHDLLCSAPAISLSIRSLIHLFTFHFKMLFLRIKYIWVL